MAAASHRSCSDALEAVIGAVYLDGGVVAAIDLIDRLFSEPLRQSASRLDRLDYKTVLQELTARLFDCTPVYLLTESGPDHAKTFATTVLVGGRVLGEGSGRSKKIAEQAAAATAFELLVASPDTCPSSRSGDGPAGWTHVWSAAPSNT